MNTSATYQPVCFPVKGGFKIVSPAQISIIESHETFCRIYRSSRNSFDISPLRIYEIARFLPDGFLQRIHKSYFVSLHYVVMINKNKTSLCVFGDKWLPIGRSYRSQLLEKVVFLE